VKWWQPLRSGRWTLLGFVGSFRIFSARMWLLDGRTVGQLIMAATSSIFGVGRQVAEWPRFVFGI